MARQDPGPTVVRIQYSTAFGFHIMSLHMREWTPATSGHDLGEVRKWSDDSLIDVETMVTDLVTLFLPFYPATASFDLASIYTNSAAGDPLLPGASKVLTGLVGTTATPGWDKAVQQTISVRSLSNNIAKIVMLDCGSFNSFAPVRVTGAAPDIDAIVAEFKSDDNGWSAADNTQPATFIGSFKTLNEALRKAYRMT